MGTAVPDSGATTLICVTKLKSDKNNLIFTTYFNTENDIRTKCLVGGKSHRKKAIIVSIVVIIHYSQTSFDKVSQTGASTSLSSISIRTDFFAIGRRLVTWKYSEWWRKTRYRQRNEKRWVESYDGQKEIVVNHIFSRQHTSHHVCRLMSAYHCSRGLEVPIDVYLAVQLIRVEIILGTLPKEVLELYKCLCNGIAVFQTL